MRILLGLVLTFSMIFLQPDGNRRWDKFLDDYEAFGKECIAARGKTLSRKEAARLRAKSIELKEALRQMPPDVSEAQKARLAELMAMYGPAQEPMEAEPVRKKSATKRAVAAIKEVESDSEDDQVAKADSLSPAQKALRDSSLKTERPQYPLQGSLVCIQTADGMPAPINLLRDSENGSQVRASRAVSFSAGPVLGLMPEFVYGAEFFAQYSALGAYLSVFGNWKSASFDAVCNESDARNLYYIWPIEEERQSYFQVSAGVLYNLGGGRPGWLGRLSVFAGAGYGRRRILWEGADGHCYKVGDLSSEGLVLDAGLMLRLTSRLSLNCVASSIKFETLGARIGLDFEF